MSRSDIRFTADQRRRWVDWHIAYCAGTPNKEFNEKAQEILAEADVSPAEEAAADPSEREVAERYSLLKEVYVSASSTPLSWLGMLAIARKSLHLEQLAVDNAVAQLTSQRDAAVEAYNAAISHAQNAEAQIGAANILSEETKGELEKTRDVIFDIKRELAAKETALKIIKMDRDAARRTVIDLIAERDAASAVTERVKEDHDEAIKSGARTADIRVEQMEMAWQQELDKREGIELTLDAAKDRAEKAERELTEAKATIGKAEASRNAWRTRAEKVECEQRKIVESLRGVINIAVRSQ